MANKRFEHIDFLRAIAILGMIVTHILSYNLGTATINTVWNYLHFVVPVFIFCSGYITYIRYADTVWSVDVLKRWYQKRASRLIAPYIIFTLIHYALWFMFPGYISGIGLSKSPQVMIASLYLLGVDYGWLPLLFVELMIITPLVLAIRKYTWPSIIMTFVTVSSALVLLFTRPVTDYRMYMWIPWSAILLLSFTAAAHDHTGRHMRLFYVAVCVCAFSVFLYGNWLLASLHLPLTLTLHKYPPDIFYLSYGVGMGSALLLLESTGIFAAARVARIIRWISTKSYEIFFVHYIVIDGIQTYRHVHPLSVWWQLFISVGITMILIRLIDTYSRWVTPRYSGK